MLQIGKNKNLKAFSLVEILISLFIFSVIITGVITITMSMVNAQKKVQARLFLTQTGQSVLESLSRQIRYGYAYSGNTVSSYQLSEGGQTIVVNAVDSSGVTGSSATTTLNLINAKNSPFLLFESQGGNPNSWADQNAFCIYNGKLYKVDSFQVETNGITYTARCNTGSVMLPESITIEKLYFDVYGSDFQNPKNPMVRIKMRLKHEEGGTVDIQTTVTQRLVTYF